MRHLAVGRRILGFAVAAALALVLAGADAAAAPAYPVVKPFTQPDGTVLSLRLWGDEFAHGWETLAGYTVIRERSTGRWEYAERSADGTLVSSGVAAGGATVPPTMHLRPTTEVINRIRIERGATPVGVPSLEAAPPWAGADTDLLFIMVAFSDLPCSFTAAQMQANMFGNAATGPGNLIDYYDEISYGSLQLVGNVIGCYTLANTKAYYDTGGGSDDDLVDEAVALADGDIDFSTFDNDGNGIVDALGIIYAGGGPHDGCDTDDPPDGGDGDDLWPHSGSTGGTLTADGVFVNPFIINSEVTYGVNPSTGCTQMQTIGLFAHEFGHSLGLPDLYDTDSSSDGLGIWSTMASQYLSTVNLSDTPPHFDPWSKWILGWISPTDKTGQNDYTAIPQAETNAFAVRLLDNPGGAEEGGSGEYFLIENRQQVNFDAQLPGCGLIVWHIEESLTGNQNEGHTAGSHRLVDVEEADGQTDLDVTGDNNNGDDGDPFPGSTGNRLWHDDRNPSSRLYSGAATGLRMSQITDCAAEMFAGFGDLPQMQIPGDVFFPDTCVGSTDHQSLSICNTGRADLEVEGIASSSTQFSVTEPSSGYPVIISPDFCFPFQVAFAPTSPGSKSATLTITSNNPADPEVEIQAFGFGSIRDIDTLIADSGDFGDVCREDFKDLTLTINNSGGCDLSVSGITSSSAQFQVASTLNYPVIVGPGDSLEVPIRLAPTTIGAKAANITVSSNDPDTPARVVPVTGNTPPGDVRVTGSTDFGEVCAGTLAEKTLSVCNVGPCNLAVTSVAFDPPCPDFTLINNPFPATVSPDSCEDVVIRFAPTSAGPKSCTLVIETDDPDTPTISKTVTADTPLPEIDVPPDLGFPPTVIQSVGACTNANPFPVSNVGNCPLRISNFAISAGSPEFSLSGLPSFPIILEPGHIAGEGDLDVVFGPTVLDRDRPGTLSVSYVSEPITGAVTVVDRALCGEGVRTGARVLATAGGVPLAEVEQIRLQRINANRNKNLLDTVDNARNLALQAVVPGAPCAPFQYHREYGTVSNPIQLLPGSYQVTVTAIVNGRRTKKSVGFDVNTCGFNPTIVVNF
jgi:M6 family metalloprotease-like protein